MQDKQNTKTTQNQQTNMDMHVGVFEVQQLKRKEQNRKNETKIHIELPTDKKPTKC